MTNSKPHLNKDSSSPIESTYQFLLYSLQASFPFILALVVSLFQFKPELLRGESLSLVAYYHLEHLFTLTLAVGVISVSRLVLLQSLEFNRIPVRLLIMIFLTATQLFCLSYIKFVFVDKLLYLILAWFGLGYARLKLYDYKRELVAASVLAIEVALLTIASLMVTFDNFAWGFCYFAAGTSSLSLARGLLIADKIIPSAMLRTTSLFTLSFYGVLGLLPKSIILVILGVKYAKCMSIRSHDIIVGGILACLITASVINIL